MIVLGKVVSIDVVRLAVSLLAPLACLLLLNELAAAGGAAFHLDLTLRNYGLAVLFWGALRGSCRS